MTEAAHSPLGPSSAERWMNCAASVAATAAMPDTDSEYALEGSAAHYLADWCRERDKRTTEYPMNQVCVKGADGKIHKIEVTREMRDHVQSFIDYVNDIEGEQLNETKVSYENYVPNGWGTLDAAIMRPREGTIVDLKYGKGVQKYAEKNEQLMLYALGVYIDFNWMYNFDTFTLVVHQPRLEHVDTWTIGVDYLLKWAREVLQPAYVATQDPKAKFKPGSWCQFCKIKATCRARAESVFLAVVNEFDDVPSAAAKTEGAAERAVTLTNDDIAKALEALPNVKAWCKAIEARALTEVAAGRAVGDYKLVEGRSNRAWEGNEAEIAARLLVAAADAKVEGVTEAALWDRTLISPTAAEKLLGKKFFAHATDKKPAGELAALIVKPKGKATLAPGSDKREQINVLDGFEVVPEV